MDRHALLGGSDDTAVAPRVGPAAHTAARLGAGLAAIAAILVLALLLDPGAGRAGAQEPPEGPRLEIASVDTDADTLSLTVTNAGDEACQALVGPSGTISVPSIVADGTTVEPLLSLGQYPDGLESTLPDRLQPLAPGDELTVALPALPVAEGRRLSTVSVGPPGTEPVRDWILPAGTTAEVTVLYGVPTFDGAPDDLCPGTTEVASATFASAAADRRATGPGDEDGLRRWLLLGAVVVALVLLVVLVLLLLGERRRRRGRGTGPGPAVAAVLAVALAVSLLAPSRPAHAQGDGGGFSGPSDLVGAAGECVAQYRAAGDPAGVLSQLDLSKITLQPKIPGDDTRYDAFGGPGAGFLFWDPTQGGTFAGGEVRTPCTSLYHELFHAVQHKNKQLIVEPCFADGTNYGIPIKEVEATRAENKLRATVPGLDPRTTYGGMPLPPDGSECKKEEEEKKKKDGDDRSDDGGSAPGGTGSGAGGSGGTGSGSGSGSGDSSSDSAGGPGSGDGTGSGSGGTGSDSGSAGGTGGPTGSSNGDPHLTTLDGLYYDLQTVGEYVALRTTGSGGDGFEIQVRQEPLPGSRAVAVNTAVGIDIAGDDVAIDLAGGAPALHLDGEVRLVTEGLDLPGGGHVDVAAARTGKAIELTWPDGSRAVVSAAGRYGLVLLVELAADRAGTVEGLLGDGDGDPANDLVVDGEPLDGSPDAIDPDDIVGALADEWRLTEPGLLPYDEGESPATFEDPSFPAAAPPAASPAAQAAAEAVCRASGIDDGPMLAGCALDVLLTGEAGFGAGAAETSALVGAVTSAVASSEEAADSGGGAGTTDPPELHDTGAATIEPGTEVRLSGEVDAGSSDTFTIGVGGPQVVFVGAEEEGRCEAVGVARVDIRHPEGYTVAALAACGAPMRVELPDAGEYELQVLSDERRDYAIVVTGVAADGDGTLRLGKETTGTIEADGQQDVYTLEVEAGDVLFFEGAMGDDCPDDDTGLGVEARLSVTLALFGVCDDAGRIEIGEDGVLELVVGTFSGSAGTGRYEMTVTEVPDDDQFTLDDGDRVGANRPGGGAGDIEVPGAHDLYLVEASEGDDLEVVPSDGCDADDLRIDVIAPSGLTEASAVACDGLTAVTLGESGTYVLRVSGVWWTAATGEYGFRLGLDG